jgi:hypothetical protein
MKCKLGVLLLAGTGLLVCPTSRTNAAQANAQSTTNPQTQGSQASSHDRHHRRHSNSRHHHRHKSTTTKH